MEGSTGQRHSTVRAGTTRHMDHDDHVHVLFTANPGWLGQLIRWLSSGKVSHAAIEYPSGMWGGRWVAEATWPTVRKVLAVKARNHVKVEFECLFDPRPGLHAIAKYFGNRYDLRRLFSLGWWYFVWKLFKWKVRYPFRSTRQQMCSELVARFFMASALPETNGWNPERITPEGLVSYCLRYGDLFRLIEGEQYVVTRGFMRRD